MFLGKLDAGRIVGANRGDRRPGNVTVLRGRTLHAFVKHQICNAIKGCVGIHLLWESTVWWFHIGAFYQPDRRPFLQKFHGIRLAAIQHRLQYYADIFEASCAHLAVNPQGGVHASRFFHIDAHEDAMLSGMLEQTLEILLAEAFIQLEADLGQLDGHI